MGVRDREQSREAAVGEAEGRLRIFLNYRREDSSGHAGRLYDDLTERLVEHDIFIDVDKIEPGADFVDVIESALDGCDVVLALIGRQWLSASTDEGLRRLDDPDDYVRLELEAALARGMRLIPVCVQGAVMPSSAQLPDTLRPLARRQALALSDTRWRRDVDDLASALGQLGEQAAQRRKREEHERRERAEAENRARVQADEERRRREEEAERMRLADEEKQRRARADAERARHERAEVALEEESRKEVREPGAAADAAATVQETPERARFAPGSQPQSRPRTIRSHVARLPAAAKENPRLVALSLLVALVAVLGVIFLLPDDAKTSAPETPTPASASPRVVGTAQAGKRLRATRGSWTGSPTRFAFEWRRCDRNGRSCTPVQGATARVYTVGSADVGHRLSVAVTASNDEGAGTAVAKATGVVTAAPEAPTATSPPVLSGTAQEGAKLTASPGSWGGTKPVRLAYRWLRCATNGASCAEIPGARGTTYVLARADVGKSVRVHVRASNAGGTRTTRSAPSGVVRAEQTADTTPAPMPSPDPAPAPKPPPVEPPP